MTAKIAKISLIVALLAMIGLMSGNLAHQVQGLMHPDNNGACSASANVDPQK